MRALSHELGRARLCCRRGEARAHFDWRYYLVRYPGARSAVGQGYFHGAYDESTGGFAYADFHILHGNHYSAYFSDALLLAAWTEGRLRTSPRSPGGTASTRAWRWGESRFGARRTAST